MNLNMLVNRSVVVHLVFDTRLTLQAPSLPPPRFSASLPSSHPHPPPAPDHKAPTGHRAPTDQKPAPATSQPTPGEFVQQKV